MKKLTNIFEAVSVFDFKRKILKPENKAKILNQIFYTTIQLSTVSQWKRLCCLPQGYILQLHVFGVLPVQQAVFGVDFL